MWRTALRFSAVGLEMGVAVAIGYGLGWWLDRKLSTGPYLMVVMLLLGIAAAFRSLYRAAREGQRIEDEPEPERDRGQEHEQEPEQDRGQEQDQNQDQDQGQDQEQDQDQGHDQGQDQEQDQDQEHDE